MSVIVRSAPFRTQPNLSSLLKLSTVFFCVMQGAGAAATANAEPVANKKKAAPKNMATVLKGNTAPLKNRSAIRGNGIVREDKQQRFHGQSVTLIVAPLDFDRNVPWSKTNIFSTGSSNFRGQELFGSSSRQTNAFRSATSVFAASDRTSLASNNNASRSAFVFNTFSYFNPQRAAPFNQFSNYGWAINRQEISNRFTDAAQREFGANWGNAAVGQAYALNQGSTGRGVTVAVIDSGIDARFATSNNANNGFSSINPEFFGRLDFRSRQTFANGSFDLNIMDDAGSHGTHVAGTIGAAFDGVGTVGIAPGANILALKGLGGDADTVSAVNYAASQPDVRIINGSYGPSARQGERIWNTGNLNAEVNAVARALSAGKLLVYATGNDFETAPVQAANPTGIPNYYYIRPENRFTGVYNDGGRNYDFSSLQRLPGYIIAVTNVDNNLQISTDANRCGVAAMWCVSAPGGGTSGGNAQGILSTVVRNLTSIKGDPTFGPDFSRNYAYFNGTSMAAPHVSGVLAVLIGAFPTYTPRDIVRLLFATTDDLGAPGVDRVYGHGLVRLDRALATGIEIANIPDNFVRTIAPGSTEIFSAPVNTDRELVVQANNAFPRGAALPGPAPHGGLVIAGVSQFNGGVIVDNGDIVIDGTLKAPFVQINQNGRLLGDGDVMGNVIVNGVLKPGTGPGPINITGSVDIKPTGSFQVDVDGVGEEGGPSSHSMAVIFGAGNYFRAGGSLDVSFRGQQEGADNTYAVRLGDRFRIVSAEQGAVVTGRFAKVTRTIDDSGDDGLPANTRLDIIYRPSSIRLAVDPASFANLSPHGVSLNRRQSNVGGLFDRYLMQNNGAIDGKAADIFDNFAGQTASGIAQSLQQLSGSSHATLVKGAMATNSTFAGLIGGRMEGLRSGLPYGSSLPALAFAEDKSLAISGNAGGLRSYAQGDARDAGPEQAYSLWGKAFGQWSHFGSDRVAPGASVSGGGVVVGGDIAATPNVNVGFALGYARNITSAIDLAGTTSSYLGAIYASGTFSGFEADVLAGAARHDSTASRTLTLNGVNFVASSKPTGLGAIFNSELGYRVRFGTSVPFWFKPFIGVAYNGLGRDGFSERGSGSFGLAFPSQGYDAVTSRTGAATGFTIVSAGGVRYGAEASLAWGHDLIDTSDRYRASLIDLPLTLSAVPTGHDALLVKTQLSADLSDRFGLFAGYGGEFRSRYQTHKVQGGLFASW